MGSVLPAPCCGGARRTPSVTRTVWAVVVMLAGLVVVRGRENIYDYEYSLPLDDQHRDTTNASGAPFPSQPFTAEYFKCQCEGNQVWNGFRCTDTQTNVSVMLPDTQTVVTSLTDDFAGVTVREVQCPPDYAQVHLYPARTPSHQFSLLSNGFLWWQQREYENYCLEHSVDAQGEQTWEAHVCLPPPSVPRCCPGSTTPAVNGVPCSDDFAHSFSPTIFMGEEVIKWPKLVEKNARNCNEFEKSLNISLNSGESDLSYESGEVSLVWKTPHHMTKKQKDGFCVMPQKGGYVATVCYDDHEAIHRTFCENATCVRKCCPEGKIQKMQDCIYAESDSQLWRPSFVDTNSLKAVPAPKNLKALFGVPHCPMYQADPEIEEDKFYLLENGFLFTPAAAANDSPARYCIDSFLNFDNTVSTKALICFGEEQVEPVCAMAKKSLYPALLILSSLFLGLTLAIYLSMPDLRNKLHGRCLISHAFSFFVAYVLMAASYLSDNLLDSSSACITLGFFKHLSLLAAFFWLNVMCFDIWRTLRKTRVIDGGVWALRRFLWYCLYSWGCPLVIALSAVVVELLPSSFDVIRPNFNNSACWFSGRKSIWLYFYMWVSLLVVVNVIFFGMVIAILVKGQNNSMLRRSRNMNRERMWLYVKLFLVMGLTWVTEVISYQSGKCVGWIFTDIINALQGLTLFLVFILSPSTVRKLKEKWCSKAQRSALTPSTTLTSSASSTQSKRKDSNVKSSYTSRFSSSSANMKDLNEEFAIPLNTLSEAPEESSNNEAHKSNTQSIGDKNEDLNLSNGDAERNAMLAKDDAVQKET